MQNWECFIDLVSVSFRESLGQSICPKQLSKKLHRILPHVASDSGLSRQGAYIVSSEDVLLDKRDGDIGAFGREVIDNPGPP
jgi:hypothetical protein